MTGEMSILGVDYSGAKADKSTWVTQGILAEGALTLISCRAMPRTELAGLLASLPGTAVAALDFPFSVPQSFAAWWLPGSTGTPGSTGAAADMPKLWEAASVMEFEEFLALRDEFVAAHGEPLRRGDLYFPECYSCLHKTNPNMVPMTFRGMQMLDGLWRAGCRVPPLSDRGHTGPLLLEAMPGAALRAFGLPFKGYKNGRRSAELRNMILDGLEASSGVRIENLAQFKGACVASHDCLDSVAAAVTACLWAVDQTLFRLPQDGPGDATRRGVAKGSPDPNGPSPINLEPDDNELATARLEGWLYAPVFLVPPARA